MIDGVRIPPPTICTHPRERWVSEGSSSWSYGYSNKPGKRVLKSSSETFGWRCGVCGVWIPNDGHKPEVSEHEVDDPGITVRW